MLPGAAKAGLDFIDDQQGAPLAGRDPARRRKDRVSGAHAALALDDFQDHRGGGIRHRGFQGLPGRYTGCG